MTPYVPSLRRARVENAVAALIAAAVVTAVGVDRSGDWPLALLIGGLCGGVLAGYPEVRYRRRGLPTLAFGGDAVTVTLKGRTRTIPWAEVAAIRHFHCRCRKQYTLVLADGTEVALPIDGFGAAEEAAIDSAFAARKTALVAAAQANTNGTSRR